MAMWRRSDRYGEVVGGFDCVQEDFKLYAELDREPVELLQYRGDVMNGGGFGDYPDCSILNLWKAKKRSRMQVTLKLPYYATIF